MTKEELKLDIDKSFELAESLLNKQGELIPMLEINFKDEHDKNGRVAVVLAVGDNKNRRDAFIRGLGLVFGAMRRMRKIKEVRYIGMMTEGWFSTPSKEEMKLMHGNVLPPSQDPNRREMLIATGLTADGLCVMKSKEMFSVEVKGKRHFTLENIPEMNDKNVSEAKSYMLDNFFIGYKKAEEDSERNRLLDVMIGKFSNISFDEMLGRSIKVLTQQVGGIDSKFIN